MEPLTLLAGAGVVVVGWMIGRISRKPKTPKQQGPNLVCGCDHELAMHDPETNRCYEMVKDVYVNNSGWRMKQCGCRQYTGDKPVDTFFSPRYTT